MPEPITETKTMANQPQLPKAALPGKNQPSPDQPSLKKQELVSAETVEKEAKKKIKLNWKIIVIIFAVILFFGTMIISAIFGGKTPATIDQPTTSVYNPTPTTVPRLSPPEFPIDNPSIYVDDPEVLQLQSTLENLITQLDQIDLRESQLNPPVLDMEVKYD